MKYSNTKGYIALMTVILTGAIVSMIAATLLTLSIIYNKNAITRTKSLMAISYADSCAEEALRVIRTKVYNGSGSMDVDGDAIDDCTYATTGVQPNLTVNAENIPSPSDGPKRKVQVVTSAISPKIILASWEDIQ